MKKLLGLTLVVGLLFFGCDPQEDEEALIARFVAVGENGYAPNTIQFQEDNTNGIEFEWTFHDGIVRTDRNPTKTYNQGGEFDVTLKVKRLDEEKTITRQITIKPAPTKIYIKKMELISTPMTDNGASWDASGGPDIYLRMTGSSGTIKTDTKSNVGSNNFPLEWTFNEPYPSLPYTNSNNQFFVYVFDEDNGTDDELMAPTGFRASEFINPYRSIIEYDDRNGTEVKLTVEWGN